LRRRELRVRVDHHGRRRRRKGAGQIDGDRALASATLRLPMAMTAACVLTCCAWLYPGSFTAKAT
jgi:hypothetical protein